MRFMMSNILNKKKKDKQTHEAASCSATFNPHKKVCKKFWKAVKRKW